MATAEQEIIARIRRLSGKRTDLAALREAEKALIDRQASVPNAQTARVLRSKAKVKTFADAKEAIAFFRKRWT